MGWFSSLLDHAAFILTAAAAIAFLYAAWRLFGTRGLMGALAAITVLFIYRKGRDDGSETTTERGRANADRAINEASHARTRAAVRDADPDKLRESDGFRRD